MKKVIGDVCFLTRDDQDFIEPLNSPLFKDKVIIYFHIWPRPEIPWKDRPEMVEYARGNIKKLINLGLLPRDFFLHSDIPINSRGSIDVLVEMSDLETARQIFIKMMEAELVDIYLYQNGRVVDKYD